MPYTVYLLWLGVRNKDSDLNVSREDTWYCVVDCLSCGAAHVTRLWKMKLKQIDVSCNNISHSLSTLVLQEELGDHTKVKKELKQEKTISGDW